MCRGCARSSIRIREGGFTTVELWTAVGVGVALLCCLGYASISSIRNASRSACLTRLHSIQTALAAYANDNDGYMPPYAFGPIAGQPDERLSFIQCVAAQGLPASGWFCPSDQHAHSAYKGIWSDFRSSSYGMPPSLARKGKPSDLGGWELALPLDSETILFCDQPYGKEASAHGKLVNAVFGDGHVSQSKASALPN